MRLLGFCRGRACWVVQGTYARQLRLMHQRTVSVSEPVCGRQRRDGGSASPCSPPPPHASHPHRRSCARFPGRALAHVLQGAPAAGIPHQAWTRGRYWLAGARVILAEVPGLPGCWGTADWKRPKGLVAPMLAPSVGRSRRDDACWGYAGSAPRSTPRSIDRSNSPPFLTNRAACSSALCETWRRAAARWSG